MSEIKSIVAISPVSNEPMGMIQRFQDEVSRVQSSFVRRGIGFQHFFLSDDAEHLPSGASVLVKHDARCGLAHTLVDGFEAILQLRSKPDLVIRLDSQEHDPSVMSTIEDHFSHSDIGALFLPVIYTIAGQPRKRFADIAAMMAQFDAGVRDLDGTCLLRLYNQEFPVGYQAYRFAALQGIVPSLRRALGTYKEETGKEPTWGFDLLAILLASKLGISLDVVYAGWMEPWLQNRTEDKVQAQQARVRSMMDLLPKLLST